MEISGRLSEEISKKEFSNGLKSVLIGRNETAYLALARSLSYVKNLLHLIVPLFWSIDGNNSNSSNNYSNNSNSSNNSNDSNNDNNDSCDVGTINSNIKSKNLRKILPQGCISCDFIDATVLSTALLLRMNQPDHPDPIHPDPIHPDSNHPNSKHLDPNHLDSNNNSNGIDIYKTEGPLFLNLIKMITKVAKDITEQQLSLNSSRRMSIASHSVGIVILIFIYLDIYMYIYICLYIQIYLFVYVCIHTFFIY
jgi:hypothetical protein